MLIVDITTCYVWGGEPAFHSTAFATTASFFFFFFLTLYAQSPCLKVGLISHVMVAAKGWTVDVAIPASL